MIDEKSATLAAPQEQCKGSENYSHGNENRIIFDVVGDVDETALDIKRKVETWANGDPDTTEPTASSGVTVALPADTGEPSITPHFDFSHIDHPHIAEWHGSLMTVKPMNEWMRQASTQPNPKPILGNYWLSGDTVFLFSMAGCGKSLLAMQIADAVSRGKSIDNEFPNELPPQPVVYFDFELTEKQQQGRYSTNYQDNFHFSDNLLRCAATELPDADPDVYEQQMLADVQQAIEVTQAKVVIVDNLTWLVGESDKGVKAANFMRMLQGLKKEMGLSMLVVAHVRKGSANVALTQDSLFGSSHLRNFTDGMIAIGKGREPRTIYLKAPKVRSVDDEFSTQVAVLERIKENPSNFLRFRFLKYDDENNQLYSDAEEQRNATAEQAKALKQQGLSVREIAEQLNASKSTISRYLNT